MAGKRPGPTLCCLLLCLVVPGLRAQNRASMGGDVAVVPGSGGAASTPVLPTAQLTLAHALALAHPAGRQMSPQEMDETDLGTAPSSAEEHWEAFVQRVRGARAAHRTRLDAVVRETFYECLEDQLLAAMDERAWQDANHMLGHTEHMEGNLGAPHSDVVKAELTLQQRDDERAAAAYRLKVCERHLGLYLPASFAETFTLVPPTPRALPERDAFASGVAQADPALLPYLTAATGTPAGEPSLSRRLVLAKVMETYDDAAFDAGAVKRSERLRDDARQSQTLAEYRYRGGEGSLYEVKAAQDAAMAAEAAWADALLRAMRSRDRVEQLMGSEP